MDDKTKGEIINLAYYYIFGASLLMHRFAQMFEDAGLGERGVARMRVNQAKASIESALRQIDSFDKNFLTSCQGSGAKWDAYMAVANELIGINLLYITHSYEHYADAAKVIELVKSQGSRNEILDELADRYKSFHSNSSNTELMVYGYIRVSSDKQTVENQRFEINNFVAREQIHIDGWIEETISGTKNYNKRELGKLLNKVQKDDLIICAELSRLGRNLFMIMEILNICMTKECRVWTIKDNYRLGEDIQSKVLAFAFGLSAEIERNLISQRTKEALARKKSEGVILGRPKGSKNSKRKLDGKEDNISRMLEKGMTKVQIAKRLKISRNTLYLFLAHH